MTDRRFVVIRVQKPGQKGSNTKYNSSHSVAGSTPSAAARKAFSKLCRSKKIKGQCTLNLTLQEIKATPSGSPSKSQGKFVIPDDSKAYKYRLKRRRSDSQVDYNGTLVTHKYKSTIKAI
jgi:hypothetical protein